MKKLLFILAVSLVACSPKPNPIDYGADKCDFCRMTIVDKQHAAEVVTNKGKAYKFDAIECMVHYVQRENDTEFAMYLVNDYFEPGELVDAKTCTYLISPNIPSPMGAFLSAFANAEAAQQFQAEKEGELFTWDELQTKLQR